MLTRTGTAWSENQFYICDSGDPFDRPSSIDFDTPPIDLDFGFGAAMVGTPDHYGTIDVTVVLHG